MSEQSSLVQQLRNAILQAPDITIDAVEVPEWKLPVTLYVKALTGREREQYLESIRKIVGKGKHKDVQVLTVDSSAKLAAKTMCLEDGTLLFTEADIPALSKKSAAALQRVVDAAAKLNGFGDDEDEEKNGDGEETTASADASSTA